jgi:chloramphenicol-sensitive protein RarD
MSRYKTGLAFGFTTYLIWGLFPLYWPLLKPANPLEIVSNRAVWTLGFCAISLALTKQLTSTLTLFRNKRVVLGLSLAAILISVNWLTYIWAVNKGHVVDASLGYYINPLVSIAFGVIILHERMSQRKWISVSVAAIGVLVLTIDAHTFPWIAITLALSFGSYGFVKKRLGLGSLESLAIETTLTLIPYGGYLLFLAHRGTGQLGHGAGLTTLLILSGAVTAIPLLLFNGAATRIPLSLMGLIQYITPSVQFCLGVFLRHEAMSTARWIGFIIIWIALIVLATDLMKSGSAGNNSVTELD